MVCEKYNIAIFIQVTETTKKMTVIKLLPGRRNTYLQNPLFEVQNL
jgi:hypothetical protein